MGRNEEGSGAIQLFHRGAPDPQTILVCVRHIVCMLCGDGHLQSRKRRDAGLADPRFILGGYLSAFARWGLSRTIPCESCVLPRCVLGFGD